MPGGFNATSNPTSTTTPTTPTPPHSQFTFCRTKVQILTPEDLPGGLTATYYHPDAPTFTSPPSSSLPLSAAPPATGGVADSDWFEEALGRPYERPLLQAPEVSATIDFSSGNNASSLWGGGGGGGLSGVAPVAFNVRWGGVMMSSKRAVGGGGPHTTVYVTTVYEAMRRRWSSYYCICHYCI
jgi:hypothetical protein